jgi:hypothetical protein
MVGGLLYLGWTGAMMGANTVEKQIEPIMGLMREKLGIKGANFETALRHAKRRLPRNLYRQALVLARAEPLASHPKLRQTLDHAALEQAAQVMRTYLEEIDLADQRKGWWLGMLGGLSFNLLFFGVVLVTVLVWRGHL